VSAPTETRLAAELWPDDVRLVTLPGMSLRVHRRVALLTGVLALGCLVASVWSMTIGDTDLSASQIVAALFGQGDASTQTVVVQWRMPRTLMALFGGAALGVSGAIFQSITRNPLGSPDVIGFSTGAYTGALIAMLLVGSTNSTSAASVGALIGGLTTALAVYLLAMKRGVNGMRLIVVGIAVAAFLNAVNSYLMIRASREAAVSAAAWGAGTLNNSTWNGVWILVASLVLLLPFTIVMARQLQMLELGDDSARALGIDAERARRLLLVLGVGYVTVITALAGPISFVALAAPQVARRFTGAAGVAMVPAALMGALLLLVADALARIVIAPGQLPVGVVTSCIGGGYLLWLLIHQARAR